MSSKISASESIEKKLRKKKNVSDSIIQYNYIDFSNVDHRLKLHLYLAILDADEREVIQFILRGEVLTSTPENQYPGILLISSQKLYILKITGPEEGDAVDRWISRVVAISIEKLQSITALPWGSGIWLSLRDTPLNNFIIVLRNQEHTQNLFTFLEKLPEMPSWKILSAPSESQCLAATKILQDIVMDKIPDADACIKLAVLLSSNVISKDDEDKNEAGGLVLVTASSILLNSNDLTWLMPPGVSLSAAVGIKCTGKQLISNLIQVEADDSMLVLQFLDEAAGSEETWKLFSQSESVLEKVVQAIRPPWEELFSVPLQVLPVSKI